ncbi:MAG: archaellin/type IV pilin N-terminal domain-containing protein [Thermoplasmataceae archaeon]
MKKVMHKDDEAVSPIIATILLIAITVVLAATLYSVIQGYTSYLGGTTPTASIKLIPTTTNTNENYQIYITGVSPNGNISLSNVELMITNNTGNITETTLGFAKSTGTAQVTVSSWIISVSAGNYLGEDPVIGLQSKVGPQSVSYLELIDTQTHATITTYSPSTV